MSFCQNKCQGHLNHHCIHAHQCTSHDHKNAKKNCKKYKNIDIMPTEGNKSAKKLKRTQQKKQQCHFNENSRGFYKKQECQTCIKLTKQLINMKKKLQQVGKDMSQVQTKNSKICNQNRQLHGVIEYYRQQLDRIIKCSSEDIRIQIKRHMKQNTQLITKNKSLLHKLYQYEQMIQKITKQNQQLNKLINGFKNEKNQLISSYNLLLEKFRKIKAEESGRDGVSVQQKKNQQIQQKYGMIIEQIKIISLKNQKQNKKLSNQNQTIRQQLQVYKIKLSNNQKINKIQIQSILQREKVLKLKIQYYQKQIKQLKQNISKLHQDIKIKQEQLTYSKKVIEKQLKLINQNKQLFNQFKQQQKQNNLQPINNINKNDKNFNNHNQDQNNIINQLNKQIKTLKQKIILLQELSKGKGTHSMQSIEQYIITIGASQAFKRIIQQKNQYIRKLIKQKQALLKKIT